MCLKYSKRKMVELFANSGDPDQMPHSAASDLGLHCLSNTLSGVSRLNALMQSNLGKIFRLHSEIFFLFFPGKYHPMCCLLNLPRAR